MATSDGFRLHPRLRADTLAAGEFSLCTLRMMNEQRYPWFILIPRRAHIKDAHELEAGDYTALWNESRALSMALMRAFDGYKLNVASLGNQVPQLHVHHVVRTTDDAAWPNPVWGAFVPMPIDASETASRIRRLTEAQPVGYRPPADTDESDN